MEYNRYTKWYPWYKNKKKIFYQEKESMKWKKSILKGNNILNYIHKRVILIYFDLRILESIYIHKIKPSLNDRTSSVELYILKWLVYVCNLVYYFHLKLFIPFHIFFFLIKYFFLVLVSWIPFCISSVISIHFLMELFVMICLKIKKNVFLKACLNYLLKKMSLIISLVVLFIILIYVYGLF